MPVITVDAVTKEPRVFQGRKQWGVKLPNGEWLSMECDFQPQRGQSFDVAIKETFKNGKTYKNATIVGPAPAAPPPAPPSLEAIAKEAFNQLKPNSYAEAPRNSKISWDDWCLMIRASWQILSSLDLPHAEAVAVISTTLIAFSNGKLETPVEAGPVSDGAEAPEAKDDDIPW